jgi:hypothetical protein
VHGGFDEENDSGKDSLNSEIETDKHESDGECFFKKYYVMLCIYRKGLNVNE